MVRETLNSVSRGSEKGEQMKKTINIFNPELNAYGTLADDILHPETHEVWYRAGYELTWADLVKLVSFGVDSVTVDWK